MRGRHPVDLARVTAALADMTAAGVDLRIVHLHWGYEFEFYPCPELMKVGRAVVRAGADVLFGTHPHVVQPMEVCFLNGYETRYGGDLPGTGCRMTDAAGVPRKALIAYSLGNFATTMYFRHCRTGLALSLHLDRDPHTGRGDWHAPEAQLVTNLHRDPTTRRAG
ncbi:MAG: CapA family protein [Gemmataceae bacterium]